MKAPSRALDWRAPVPGTWALVAVLLGAHLVSALVLGGGLDALAFDRSAEARVAVGGQEAGRVAAGEVWRLATSVLLHGDLLHLAINAVALYTLGRLLEPWLGAVRLLGWFVIGGLCGSAASQLAGVAQSDGASGGAFALLAAAAVLGWRWRRSLPPDDRWLLGPVLQGFLVLNVVLSFAVPVLDAAGHLGGLAAGLALGAVHGRVRAPRAWPAVHGVLLLLFVGACSWGWLSIS